VCSAVATNDLVSQILYGDLSHWIERRRPTASHTLRRHCSHRGLWSGRLSWSGMAVSAMQAWPQDDRADREHIRIERRQSAGFFEQE